MSSCPALPETSAVCAVGDEMETKGWHGGKANKSSRCQGGAGSRAGARAEPGGCEETAALFSQPRLCNWLMVLSAAVAAVFCVVFIELECGVMARAETPIALKHTVKIGLKFCSLGCCCLLCVVPARRPSVALQSEIAFF